MKSEITKPTRDLSEVGMKNQKITPSTGDAKLQMIYGELSQEAQQDKDSIDPSKSFLEGINSELFIEREREYKDTEKHWIRTKVWLKVANDLAQETKRRFGRGIRYFTLPAYYRLDVSLFLRENLLDVLERSADGNVKKVYVAAFELEPTKYARMIGHAPEFCLFGETSVEDALTDPRNPYYDELLHLFPFDIINLDLTTSLVPQHEGPYSKTLRAIDTIFNRQAHYANKWALFITFRNMSTEWEENALEQLLFNLQSNLDNYPGVLQAFDKLYDEKQVSKLFKKDAHTCTSQAVAKWLVDRANTNNLDFKSLHCYYYQRYLDGIHPYYIYKQVIVFSRGDVYPGVVPTKGTPRQTWMDDDLVACINQHKCVDVEEKILITLESLPSFEDNIRKDIDELCKMID